MARHEALLSFSTEHQYMLLLLWKISFGFTNAIDVKRISRYIVYAYSADVRPHFWDEEANLFTIVRSSDPLRVQAEAEHREIHEAVVAISNKPGNEAHIHRFVELLQKHIHFEELTLFNHLQEQIAHLKEQVAADIVAKLRIRTLTDPDSKYPDLYWIDMSLFKK